MDSDERRLTMDAGRARYLALAVSIAAAAGCVGPESEPGVVRRDSAGVRIVETRSPQWGEGDAWCVDPEPMLDLARTGDGLEYEFSRVRAAARLADGSIIVANDDPPEARLFTADGEYRVTYGREGEGPGEFRRLTSVHALKGDSVLAFDSRLRRMTVFDAAGSVARTIEASRLGEVWRVHPVADGKTAVARYAVFDFPESGMYRRIFDVLVLNRAGQVVDSVARVPGYDGFLFEIGDAPPLFSHRAPMSAGRDRVYVVPSDSVEVVVYGIDGSHIMTVRVPGYDLRLSPEQVEAERATMRLPASAPPAQRDAINALAEALPSPQTRPAFEALLVDRENYLWATEYLGRSEQDHPVRSFVFDPNGAWLGMVELPARFRTLEIGSDYVIGVRLDDMRVEHVEVLRLHREACGSG